MRQGIDLRMCQELSETIKEIFQTKLLYFFAYIEKVIEILNEKETQSRA